MEEKIFDEVIKVNLGGTFLVNQITANAMKEFKINGSIVNISSIAGTCELLTYQVLIVGICFQLQIKYGLNMY